MANRQKNLQGSQINFSLVSKESDIGSVGKSKRSKMKSQPSVVDVISEQQKQYLPSVAKAKQGHPKRHNFNNIHVEIKSKRNFQSVQNDPMQTKNTVFGWARNSSQNRYNGGLKELLCQPNQKILKLGNKDVMSMRSSPDLPGGIGKMVQLAHHSQRQQADNLHTEGLLAEDSIQYQDPSM